MDETAKGCEVMTEKRKPGEIRYHREIPDVRVERIGVHYYVKAGCRSEIFHEPCEVEFFLIAELVSWIKENLGDHAGLLRVRMPSLDPPADTAQVGQERA